MNMHITPRRIYLTRNGQSTNDAVYRSDAPLSPRGQAYAEQLPRFLNHLRKSENISSALKVPPWDVYLKADLDVAAPAIDRNIKLF
jgi:hypothetical protein